MRRLWILAAVASIAVLGTGRAGAAGTVAVNCTDNPHALTLALANPGVTDGTEFAITGTCTGTFPIAHSVTLSGTEGGATLDALGLGTVLTIEAGKTVEVDHLTITGGHGGSNGVGGIENFGTLTLKHSSVSNNRADGAFSVSGIDNAGTLTLRHTGVSANTESPAGFDTSGTIRNREGATMSLTHTSVSENVVNPGAFFAVSAIDNAGSAELKHSSVSGNTLSAFFAFGAISGSGALTIEESEVSGNSAEGVGAAVGGINNSSGFSGAYGILTLTKSAVSGNSASASGSGARAVGGILDGGPFVEGGTAAVTNATESIVSGNTASAPPDGTVVGGIYQDVPGTVTLTKSAVVNNTPPNCNFNDPACA